MRESRIMEYQVKTYYNKEELPPLNDVKFFHFVTSFDWNKNISYYKPLMFIVFRDNKPIASMFALIMRVNRFLYGSSLFKRCYISQQPSFFVEDINKIEIFDLLISSLVKEVENKVYFIEYRNLGDAVFGYKGFRENGFYSIKWINVRNSLQRKRKIWEQLSSTRRNQVNKAKRKGVVLEEVTSYEKLPEIYRLIDKSRNWKISNKFPPYQYFENFFNNYVADGKGKILISRYNEKIIGGIILGFEQKTVYVLYFWGKEKSYKLYYPTVFTIYSAMEMAEKEGYDYFDFMDSGYLNINAGKPRFLLQFGGKPKATRRWYRFNWRLLNFFAKKIYD